MAHLQSPAPAGHRRIDDLLAEYGASHQNPTNKTIHWIAVPVIAWCVLAFLRLAPLSEQMRAATGIDWAVLVSAAAVVYYRTLSTPLAIGMAAFCLACLMIADAVVRHAGLPLWQVAAGLFAVAWVMQFIGHAIEGKRPSFFKDLQFLLIGPAWLMASLLGRMGIRY